VKLATIPVAITNIEPPQGGTFEDLHQVLAKEKFDVLKESKPDK